LKEVRTEDGQKSKFHKAIALVNSGQSNMTPNKTKLIYPVSPGRSSQTYIVATAFLSLFALVGISYNGLPFFYDFMTKEFGWPRAVVTSGNAVGKLFLGPLFGFAEGWNQTEKDWQLLIRNPLNYCIAAKIEGKVVETATAINYFNNVVWIY
jgi:hypothetical protein